MKKAILTCGLFSMMMILTSFTQTTDIGGNGNQGSNKPPLVIGIGGNGNQGSNKPPLVIGIGGNGNQGSNKPPLIIGIGGNGNQGSQRASQSL